jgi:hypothetical protein
MVLPTATPSRISTTATEIPSSTEIMLANIAVTASTIATNKTVSMLYLRRQKRLLACQEPSALGGSRVDHQEAHTGGIHRRSSASQHVAHEWVNISG